MKGYKIRLLTAMCIYGTIGIFLDSLPLSSAAIACFRGLFGGAALLIYLFLFRKPDLKGLLKYLPLLCFSGAVMGLNWMLLFESYRHTTVATATVCYYLAPVFLILASPFLGERMTPKKLLCVGISLIGIVFVSGVLEDTAENSGHLLGIALGVGAAVFYAIVMICNKKMAQVPPIEKTVVQLLAAGLALLPYVLSQGPIHFELLEASHWIRFVCLILLHTGIAYVLYFDSVGHLSAATVGLFSYLDPVVAICLSWPILNQPMTLSTFFGALLILGSALYSEWTPKKIGNQS